MAIFPSAERTSLTELDVAYPIHIHVRFQGEPVGWICTYSLTMTSTDRESLLEPVNWMESEEKRVTRLPTRRIFLYNICEVCGQHF